MERNKGTIQKVKQEKFYFARNPRLYEISLL
jgi:hypothetical protein